MDSIRYSYLHGQHRHVTVARDVDLEKKIVFVGISVCHPSDSFDKKMGRKMSAGRLKALESHSENIRQKAIEMRDSKEKGEIVMKQFELISLTGKTVDCAYMVPLGDLKPFETTMEFLCTGEKVPTCVKQLAKQWMDDRGIILQKRLELTTTAEADA